MNWDEPRMFKARPATVTATKSGQKMWMQAPACLRGSFSALHRTAWTIVLVSNAHAVLEQRDSVRIHSGHRKTTCATKLPRLLDTGDLTEYPGALCISSEISTKQCGAAATDFPKCGFCTRETVQYIPTTHSKPARGFYQH